MCRSDPPRQDLESAHARRIRSRRSACADDPAGFTPRRAPGIKRGTHCAAGSGPPPMGPGGHPSGYRSPRYSTALRRPRPVPDPSSHRRLPRDRTSRRCHRLAPDRRPLRSTRRDGAEPGRPAQPRRGGWHGRRSVGRTGAVSGIGCLRRARRLPLAPSHSSRFSAPLRAPSGGSCSLPPGAPTRLDRCRPKISQRSHRRNDCR